MIFFNLNNYFCFLCVGKSENEKIIIHIESNVYLLQLYKHIKITITSIFIESDSELCFKIRNCEFNENNFRKICYPV